MPDIRFFRRVGPFTLHEIAAVVDAAPLASTDAASSIFDIASLEDAGPNDISVYSDVRYLKYLKDTRAGAVIISRDLARHAPCHSKLLYVDNPRLAYAQVGQLFYPLPALRSGVDPASRVHPDATVGYDCQIDAGAVIGANAVIGNRCRVGFNAVISDGVRLGHDCRIGPNSHISHALIGQRVTIESNVTIGAQGFGFVMSAAGLMRMLQLGRVIIEDDVEIGANSAIDRGATGDTVIGGGTVIDNLVHIAHNARLGRRCVICAQVGIAGSTVVGDGVMMGGQVGVADHLTVGAHAQIAAKSGVTRDVVAGEVLGGFPAIPLKHWHRQTVTLARLTRKQPDRGVD